jgi:predicted dehydrogenase
MDTGARLNVAIIGAGYVARSVHIPFLKALRGASVVAVADSIPERAAAVASRFAIPLFTSDYKDLLQSEQIQVVDICTPPQSHAEIARQAIEAGMDVIVEKPLATSMAECISIKEALKRVPTTHLGVVLNLRYMPLVRSVIQTLHSGRLGEIHGVSALIHTSPPREQWSEGSPISAYGVLYDYLPHIVDLILWALQAHPVSVRCVGGQERSRFLLIVEACSAITGRCRLLFDVAWTSATLFRSVYFWGTEQDLLVDLQDQCWYLSRGHLTPWSRGAKLLRRISSLSRRAMRGRIAIKYGAMEYHRELLRDFIEAFARGRCPSVSFLDGLMHVAVIEAAVRSHAEDRWVMLRFDPEAYVWNFW